MSSVEALLYSLPLTHLMVLEYLLRNANINHVHTKVAEQLGLSYHTVLAALKKLRALDVIVKIPPKIKNCRGCSYSVQPWVCKEVLSALRKDLIKSQPK